MVGMLVGRIDGYKQDRGWGWIHYLASDNKVVKFFFHVSQVKSGTPTLDARVSFKPFAAERGPQAREIEILEQVEAPVADAPAESSDKAVK
jgi:cold shock CspA family protein